MDTTFLPPPGATPGDIAFVSHSGAICAAVIDWARVQGMDDPERYFTEPDSEEAQQVKQQQEQQAQQEAQQQQEYQERLLAMQQEIETRKADNNDAKVIEEGRQHDEDIQFKYVELGIMQETKEAEMAVDLAQTMAGGVNEQDQSGSAAANG